MKMKSLMLLVVALGCGLVAMLGVQKVLSGDRGERVERVRVLVALGDIDPGVPLTKENVSFRDVSKDAVPENAVTKPEEYEERALTSRTFTNQVICVPQLGEKGVFGATIDIPHGMRVVTTPVNATTAHSGLMKPGDRVDVLATYTIQRSGIGAVTRTKTILEYIQVWATDHTRVGFEEAANKMNTKEGAKNVSLLVSPRQAAFLEYAKSKGVIHLAMRSKTDTLRTETIDIDDQKMTDFESIFNPEEKKETPKPETQAAKPSFADFLNKQQAAADKTEKPKSTWKITIYSGQEKRVEEVDLPVKNVPAPMLETTSTKSKNSDLFSAVGGFFGLPVQIQ